MNAPVHVLPYSVPTAMPLGKSEDFYFLVFDSDGEVSEVEIAFGDGSVEKATNLGQTLFSARHAYRQEGEFTVQVKAKDGQGREYDREFKVRVARGAATESSGWCRRDGTVHHSWRPNLARLEAKGGGER